MIICGIDGRLDAEGRYHPWRLAIYDRYKTHISRQYFGSIDSEITWIRTPRHPLYGDLTKLGRTLSAQVSEIAEIVQLAGFDRIYLSTVHCSGPIAAEFIKAGLDIVPVEIEEDGDDFLKIGDNAGKEIGAILYKLEGRHESL